jgi:hypothetical protein
MAPTPSRLLPIVTPRKVIDYYFDKPTETFSYKCKKCLQSKKLKQNSGLSNLKNHPTACVGNNYALKLQELLAHSNPASLSSPGQTRMKQHFVPSYSSPEVDVYKWIEWVVMQHQPLSEVDNPLTREGTKYSSISSKSLRKYILELTPLVEAKIREELDNACFTIALDGWTEGSTHYRCFCHIYINKAGELGKKQCLHVPQLRLIKRMLLDLGLMNT